MARDEDDQKYAEGIPGKSEAGLYLPRFISVFSSSMFGRRQSV